MNDNIDYFQEYAKFLSNIKRSNNKQAKARCPFHDDEEPSLSINLEEGVFNCFGCGKSGNFKKFKKLLSDKNNKKHISATYDYTDENGKLLYQVVRYEPKDFSVRRPDGKGGWIIGLGETRKVIYRLPQVLNSKEVIIVEGEKDANNLSKLGFTATTNPFGAGKWQDEYSKWFKDKDVIIIPDNDEVGLKHANDVAYKLSGIAKTIKIILLPHSCDVSEYLNKGGTKEDLINLFNSAQYVDTKKISELKRAKKSKKEEKIKKVEKGFINLNNGQLAENIYNENLNPPIQFLIYSGTTFVIQPEIPENEEHPWYIPLQDKLIYDRTVLLPSNISDYGSEEQLFNKIQSFIHKYLEIEPFYEILSTYYVLLTWIYDKFTALPYLRFLGDYGTGKTRALQTIGSICYKPIFVAGALTPAVVFRCIERYKGTLIIDEGDFKVSEEWTQIIKILNTGYQKGMRVLRISEKGNKFKPESFDTYSPKIIATRKFFYDQALESRMITLKIKGLTRNDIPLHLEEKFEQEAQELRNQLLLWRLKKYNENIFLKEEYIENVEPRLNQIILPLRSIIKNTEFQYKLDEFIKEYQEQLIMMKEMSNPSIIAKTIIQLWEEGNQEPLIGDIAKKINESNEDLRGELISSRKIGEVIRRELYLKVIKKRNRYGVRLTESEIELLKRRFNIQ